MAGINIKNIPNATSLSTEDFVIVEQTTGTKKTSINDLTKTGTVVHYSENPDTIVLQKPDMIEKVNNIQYDITKVSSQLEQKPLFNTNNEISATRLARIRNDGTNNGLSNPQGYCFNGVNHFVAYRQYFGTGDDTLTKIVKYDANFNELIKIEGNFGHGNSICYNDSYIYICDLNRKVYKLNSLDLSLVKTFIIPYDVSAISFYKKFYLLSNDKIYITNDFNNYEEISFVLPVNAGVSQGFEVDEEFIYMLRTAPNTILQYTLRGELKYIYRLPFNSDKVFRIGEVEDLSKIGNEFYFTSLTLDEENKKEIISFNKTNLKNNITGISDQNFVNLFKNNVANTIFVDNTNTNKNPLGTFSNPFPTLYEALELVSSSFMKNSIIYIKENVTLLDENIFFDGTLNNVKIESVGSSVTIKDLTLKRCNATLMKIKCNNVNIQDCNIIGMIGYETLKCYTSNVTLYGGFIDVTKPVILYGSTLNGVHNQNVTTSDYGCHGIFSYDVNFNIGNTLTNDMIEKAKVIELLIKYDNKYFNFSLSGVGLREINVTNVHNGDNGYTIASIHIQRTSKNLTLVDVREITHENIANIITSATEKCKIERLTYVL